MSEQITAWLAVKLILSCITFLMVICYIINNKAYKQSNITLSSFVSALFSLISVVLVFLYANGSYSDLNMLFVLRGIQYAFTFRPMLFAFHFNIVRVQGGDKPLVYIGYIWMLVTIGVSFAATFMPTNDYDDSYGVHSYNVIVTATLSSWGFIAIIVLLYIRNSQLFVSSETSVVIYIFLVLIQTVTTTVIVFVPFDRYGPHPAVSFFLIDMTMLFAIIMAAHYGPAWIQDELEEPKENTHPIYGDLGPNRGFD